jgi:hypothetical protein
MTAMFVDRPLPNYLNGKKEAENESLEKAFVEKGCFWINRFVF